MSPSVIVASIAAGLTLLAAVTGAIALFLSWQEGNAKDDAAGKLATENQAKFLGLEKQASDAKSAQQTVEIELNKTKIQLAQTERKIGPRRLTFDEKKWLASFLKDAPKEGRIYVTQYALGDREAWDFAGDLIEVLVRAGFTLDQKAVYHRNTPEPMPSNVPPDLVFQFMDREEERRSRYKNTNVGIEFQRKTLDPRKVPGWLPYLEQGLWQLGYRLNNGGMNWHAPDDMTVIEVGEKPKYPEN